MRNLQAELDQHMHDRHVIPEFATLCKLPYLNAFIKEGTCSIMHHYFANDSDADDRYASVRSCSFPSRAGCALNHDVHG